MKMNPEIKARWVAALRSGEYHQGKSALRTGETQFCCLGVLCDLWNPTKWGSSMHPYDGLTPARVDEWASFDPGMRVQIGGHLAPLYVHNDSCRTFAEIADAIEEQL